MAVARQGPPPSRPNPASRVHQILGHILSAARWGGWLALPGGLTLGYFAASVLLPSASAIRTGTPFRHLAFWLSGPDLGDP